MARWARDGFQGFWLDPTAGQTAMALSCNDGYTRAACWAAAAFDFDSIQSFDRRGMS
jgi:hypothetical protein